MAVPFLTLSIFPDLADARGAVINLNSLALQVDKGADKSRFLDAGLADRYLRKLHARLGVAFSLGGYLEDRRDLWRGSYLKEDAAVHLGVDINLPAGTRVSVARSCTVAHIEHDNDRDGGWGSVIIFALDQPVGNITHFLYAHLSAAGIAVGVGAHVQAGQIVATLGQSHENGGWYEHLHVQALTQDAWDKTGGRLEKFDGYDGSQEGPSHKLFPNPLPLVTAA